MSEGEQKLVDTGGDYLYAIKNGQQLDNPAWRSCRIIVTSKRLVLSTNGGKQAIPHSKIQFVDDPENVVPGEFDVTTATALRIGNNVILVDAQHIDDFGHEYLRAVLHDEVLLAKYPAVVGGVVQGDTGWSKARFRFDDETIQLGLPDNQTVSFPIEDVGTVETESQQVMDQTRTVVQVEHTDEQDRSVETHLSGMEFHVEALERLLTTVIEEREGEYELSELESQVLMALYSGVSPFEMADFVGVSVDEVEEAYQNLLEAGAVDKVRERTEVTLNAHGRNLASEAMNEQ